MQSLTNSEFCINLISGECRILKGGGERQIKGSGNLWDEALAKLYFVTEPPPQ